MRLACAITDSVVPNHHASDRHDAVAARPLQPATAIDDDEPVVSVFIAEEFALTCI
jgi:hypothetical protein